MEFTEKRAIYRQIMDWMSDKILTGEWEEDARILSVRELAVLLQVNPNTVMRSFEGLQENGILYNKRGIGYFVSADARKNLYEKKKEEFIREILPPVFDKMEILRVTSDDIGVLYRNYLTEKKTRNENER